MALLRRVLSALLELTTDFPLPAKLRYLSSPMQWSEKVREGQRGSERSGVCGHFQSSGFLRFRVFQVLTASGVAIGALQGQFGGSKPEEIDSQNLWRKALQRFLARTA